MKVTKVQTLSALYPVHSGATVGSGGVHSVE